MAFFYSGKKRDGGMLPGPVCRTTTDGQLDSHDGPSGAISMLHMLHPVAMTSWRLEILRVPDSRHHDYTTPHHTEHTSVGTNTNKQQHNYPVQAINHHMWGIQSLLKTNLTHNVLSWSVDLQYLSSNVPDVLISQVLKLIFWNQMTRFLSTRIKVESWPDEWFHF